MSLLLEKHKIVDTEKTIGKDEPIKTINEAIKTLNDIPKFKRKNCHSSNCTIIHQSWTNYEVPTLIKSYLRSCLVINSNYEYWFWSDDDNRQLVEISHPELMEFYNSANDIARSDIARIIYLEKFGGVFIDLDVECLLPLASLIGSDECTFSQISLKHALVTDLSFPLVSNFFIACKKEHPFLTRIIQHFKTLYHDVNEENVMSLTGTIALTNLYHDFKSLHPASVPNIHNHRTFGTSTRFNRKFFELCNSEDKISSVSKIKGITKEKILNECNFSNVHNSMIEHIYIEHHYKALWMEIRIIHTQDTFFLPTIVDEVIT